jgi:uncharacterized membrane protein YgcG
LQTSALQLWNIGVKRSGFVADFDIRVSDVQEVSRLLSSVDAWVECRSVLMLATLLHIVIVATFACGSAALARDLPPFQIAINDFAGMIPPASYADLTQRLKHFKTQSGHTVSILTVASLEEDETIETLATQAFRRLPLNELELRKALLVVIARKEHLVGFEAGDELKPRFPQAPVRQKLQSHLDVYINGLRPDLGVYGGVHFILGVISGEFRAATTTEEEALENASIHGAGAGAIFAILLAPFLAFFVSMLLGIYSKHAGFQRETRLFLGIVMGGGTAQLVAILMGMISPFSTGLWYFILLLGMTLGAFGSLTEYWMKGDWSGIPRIKEKIKRKPEDNIGI